MKLYLYSTEDDEIVLNKTLKNEKVIDINFKASCNRLDTQVILNYKKGNFDPNAYNYIKMDIGFAKYFFITNKEINFASALKGLCFMHNYTVNIKIFLL